MHVHALAVYVVTQVNNRSAVMCSESLERMAAREALSFFAGAGAQKLGLALIALGGAAKISGKQCCHCPCGSPNHEREHDSCSAAMCCNGA